MDQFFSWAVAQKTRIIGVWKILYIFLFGLLVIGSVSIARLDTTALLFNELGRQLGKLALVLFIVIAIPGIARRFGYRHKAVALIMIFRRYLGITMYLLALIHASFVRLVFVASGRIPLSPAPTFVLFGTLALTLLFFLFVTSNDGSVRKLGVWWQRIHNLFYIIMWLIFLHVGLQRLGVWTVLIGVTSIIELVSFIWAWTHSFSPPSR